MQSDHLEFQSVPIQPVECLKEAKALIGEQYWLFVGITTVGLLIASAVPFNILLGPMMCGIYLCFRDRMNGKRAAFDTLFKGFDYFVETLIATLILMAVSMVVIVPCYIVMMIVIFGASHSGDEAVPLMLGVIFGVSAIMIVFFVLIYVLFIFVYPLILFGRMKAIPAIKTSMRASLANFAGLLGLVLLIFLISTVAAMCCYVPAFLVAPILIGSVLMAYRKVFPDGFVSEPPLDASVIPDEGKPTPQPPKPNDFA